MPKTTKTPKNMTKPKPEVNGTTAPEVLTLSEAAAWLRVSEELVVQLAAAGQLPARKLGTNWRFLKESLVDWLRQPELPTDLNTKSMLSIIGAFKDDETLEPMVEEIYRQRKQHPVEG